MVIHELAVLALAATLVWAAVSDALWFRIPNAIPLTILTLFPLAAVSGGQSLETALWSLLVATGVFSVGFLLFWRGALGGGDVKLLSALALWAGPKYILSLVLVIALAGGALALAALLVRRSPYLSLASINLRMALARSVPAETGKNGGTLPYGIAIAAGGLLLCLQLFRQVAA